MWTEDDLVVDVSGGYWIDSSLKGFTAAYGDGRVGAILPSDYAAYARIIHPAYRRSDLPGRRNCVVRWMTVATANGRTMHPLAEWDFLIATVPDQKSQPGVWDRPPKIGQLDAHDTAAISSTLRLHTEQPEHCWYAIWEGNTALDHLRGVGGRLTVTGREYFVVGDGVDALGTHLDGVSPSLCWPDDRAWCVSSNVDLMATYVGGTEECVDALVDHPGLEAFRVHAMDKITWDSDTINRRPRGDRRIGE